MENIVLEEFSGGFFFVCFVFFSVWVFFGGEGGCWVF